MTDNNRATPFSIKLVDTVIRIELMFEYIREYCRDYITEEQASFTVRTEPEDISFERERSVKEAEQNYSDAYLETLAVDDMGYLFTAKSGTGKSTHTRLWRERFGKRTM